MMGITLCARYSRRIPKTWKGYRFQHSSVRGSGPLNVLFLGRNAFSCKTLEHLHKASDVWKTITIATTPDEYIGRRRDQLSVSPLKTLAASLQLPVLEIPKDKAIAANWLPPNKSDFPFDSSVIVTASYGRAVPLVLLDHFATRLNVHPSLLPRYRGAAPLQRTILDRLEETGVSIIDMNDISQGGFDSGNIRAKSGVVAIPRSIDYLTLESFLANIGGNLLASTLRDLIHGKSVSVPQDHSQATRALSIKPAMYEIDWDNTHATQVDRLHRALSFKKSLFTHMLTSQGREVRLTKLHCADHNLLPANTKPGHARYFPEEKVVAIACKASSEVHVTELQPQGKKPLTAKSWWNGTQSKMLVAGLLPLGRP